MFLSNLKTLIKPLGYVPRYRQWEPEIIELPPPRFVVMPLEYPGQLYYLPMVEIGQQVQRNQIIGRSKLGHAAHASVSGQVRDILLVWTARGYKVPAILIQRDENLSAAGEESLGQSVEQEERISVEARLKGLGVISPWTTPGRFHHEEEADYPEISKIIIKGVNEEPSVFLFELLLQQYPELIMTGMDLLSNLAPRAEIILTVPEYLADFATDKYSSRARVNGLPREYSQRVEQLVIPQLAGQMIPNTEAYRKHGVAVISTEYLINLVEAMTEGQPFVDKYLTVAGTDLASPRTVKIPIGTPIRHVLEALELDPADYRRILVGGPMKGSAQYTTYTPLTKSSHGLYLMSEQELPLEVNLNCTNCGRCTQVCPVKLQVHLIGRLAESDMLSDAQAYHPEACNGCGMCGFVCPSHRPLVQLIQLARKYGTKDEYIPQTECSRDTSLERWELEFQNTDTLDAGADAGGDSQSLSVQV